MSADLSTHWAYLQNEWRAAKAAPLSLRKAMVVVGLIDAFADRMAVAGLHDDILAFRAGLAGDNSALLQVFELAAHRANGPRLEVMTVGVLVSEMSRLPVEDFMVSLYNDHTVQRLMLIDPDSTARLAHDVLRQALEELDRIVTGTALVDPGSAEQI